MKIYMTCDSNSGGKFWELETKGKKYVTRFGKLGAKGREMSKSFPSKSECEEAAEKLVKQKRNKGYSEKKSQKRKQLDSSDNENESSEISIEPPTKKRKITTKKNKKTKPKRNKKKKQLESEESESESESDGYNSDDIKNEKTLKKMLKLDSVLLQDSNQKNKFEVIVNNKSYTVVQGKIGKNGKKKNKNFPSKKKAFDAALQLLVAKMHDDWTIVEEDESQSSSSSSEEEEEPGIFDEYSFGLSGSFSKSQTEIKKMIKDLGGKINAKINKKTDFLLVKNSNTNLKSTKCLDAKKFSVPIINEEFLFDSIDKNKKLDYKTYIIEEEESEEEQEEESDDDDNDIKMKDKKKNKNKKNKSDDKAEKDDDESSDDDNDNNNKKSTQKIHKFKGSAPVDEHFELGTDGYSVFEENSVVWDAMLNQTNINKNNNKFYKLQIIKSDSTYPNYYFWTHWGRVGYKGQNSNIPGSKDECIEKFKEKFHAKTLNDWEYRDDFEPRAKKYTYLPMDYGNDDDDDDTDDDDQKMDDKSGCKLDKNIQNLVKLIFDKEMMAEQMKEIGYDAKKLPLGKVDKSIITKAYKVLKDIESAIRKGNKEADENDDDDDDDDDSDSDSDDNSNKRRSKRKRTKSSRKVSSTSVTELTSKYYTLIPHIFGMQERPPLINSEKSLSKEMKLIEALQEIEVAKRLIKESKNINKNPIEKHFDLLKCNMETIEKSTDLFKMLNDYTQLTHAQTHNRYKLTVECAYELNRNGSDQRYKPYENNHNRMLLWHGSRLTNFVGIISQGLRIAPPEAPVTGYMFGKGVYFADMCSKSANYCFTSPANNTGLILLCEVALGNMNELLHSDYYADQLPKDKLSTKGCGKTTPDPSTYQKLDNGCVVPIGKGVKDNQLRGDLLYNEYIVYNTAQIKMKYLLRLKFDYGNDGW